MLTKFVHGVAFGAGFGIALGALAWLWTYIAAKPLNMHVPTSSTERPGSPLLSSELAETFPSFNEGSMKERIKAATAITLAQFEKAPNGEMQAIITQVLKAPEDFNYAVGDEHSSERYFPEKGRSKGDKVIVFFVGAPPRFAQSFSVYGDRIPGAADLRLRDFIEMVDEAGK